MSRDHQATVEPFQFSSRYVGVAYEGSYRKDSGVKRINQHENLKKEGKIKFYI
jgi:hypothetical protein